MKVNKISRDGKVSIEFNQKMKVPPFTELMGKRRQLRSALKMSDLNVQRDIVDMSFDLRSGIPKQALKYSLALSQWTERKIEVQLNFSNPEAVSQGNYRDGVTIKIKNGKWFKSAETNEMLKPENS